MKSIKKYNSSQSRRYSCVKVTKFNVPFKIIYTTTTKNNPTIFASLGSGQSLNLVHDSNLPDGALQGSHSLLHRAALRLLDIRVVRRKRSRVDHGGLTGSATARCSRSSTRPLRHWHCSSGHSIGGQGWSSSGSNGWGNSWTIRCHGSGSWGHGYLGKGHSLWRVGHNRRAADHIHRGDGHRLGGGGHIPNGEGHSLRGGGHSSGSWGHNSWTISCPSLSGGRHSLRGGRHTRRGEGLSRTLTISCPRCGKEGHSRWGKDRTHRVGGHSGGRRSHSSWGWSTWCSVTTL